MMLLSSFAAAMGAVQVPFYPILPPCPPDLPRCWQIVIKFPVLLVSLAIQVVLFYKVNAASYLSKYAVEKKGMCEIEGESRGQETKYLPDVRPFRDDFDFCLFQRTTLYQIWGVQVIYGVFFIVFAILVCTIPRKKVAAYIVGIMEFIVNGALWWGLDGTIGHFQKGYDLSQKNYRWHGCKDWTGPGMSYECIKPYETIRADTVSDAQIEKRCGVNPLDVLKYGNDLTWVLACLILFVVFAALGIMIPKLAAEGREKNGLATSTVTPDVEEVSYKELPANAVA